MPDSRPPRQEEEGDIEGVAHVEVEIRSNGTVWINVNGTTVFRIRKIEQLQITDRRRQSPKRT